MAVPAHVEWLKEGVARWNKRRQRVKFRPDLSGVRFFELLPPDFRDSPKTSRTFERINLSDSNLVGADLSDLNFQKANFSGADLTDADLSLSSFDGANFSGAKLIEIETKNSSFIGAIFQRSTIEPQTFIGSIIDGASFVDIDVPEEQILRLQGQGARYFESVAVYGERKKVEERLAYLAPSSAGDREAPDDRTLKNKYDVFYGTNREEIYQRGALVDFSSSTKNYLSYGLCEVIVPDGRRVGSLGSPLWKRLWNRKDDRLKLEAIIALDEQLFFRHVHASADKMKIKQKPTIFVHGFNNSFESAVLRAAQIGHDLGIGQGVGLFSWPSRGKKRAYSADEASAEASKYLLADFIEKFVLNSPTSSINIIAHSMGCRCLLGALEVLSSSRSKVLGQIDQIILAAADVDTAIMPRLGLAATNHARRTTSYVSGYDKALKLSGWLHGFPRVGFLPPTFVMSGMDTVIVNDDDLGTLSHGYVGSNRQVLNDMYDLLSKNLDPNLRFSVVPQSGGFWRIRD